MDVEKQRRSELIRALDPDFVCFEEVRLQHLTFPRLTVRADIVAIPIAPQFQGYALAFEVKDPSEQWQYKNWSKTIRQASDYVYGKILPDPRLNEHVGRRISCSFVYPSPEYIRTMPTEEDSIIVGIFHLAIHFRVGRAFIDTSRREKRFCLTMGPNDVWRSDVGYTGQAEGLIKGKRTVGSQRVDILRELDGIGDD